MFDTRLMILAAKLAVAAALVVWVALTAANYITNDPNVDPLKAGGLYPVQQRAVDTKQ